MIVVANGTAQGQASGGRRTLAVDLKAGTINARPVASWTLDELTDSLGRPTAVTPGIEGITGSQLHYHDQGLSLWFQPKRADPAQHLWVVTMYFARSWDVDHREWYRPFTGAVVPAVDGNWKQSQLQTEFASLHPTIKTADESRREIQSSGLSRMGVRSVANDFLNMSVPGAGISFVLEPSTKFLERVVLRTVTDSTR